MGISSGFPGAPRGYPGSQHSADAGRRSIVHGQMRVKRRARAISTARLRRSHALQLQPIDLVVYEGPYQKENSSWRRLPT